MSNCKDIINFWKLCELATFPELSIYDKSIVSFKTLYDEFFHKNKKIYEYKTNATVLQKQYIGFIQTEALIKYIYEELQALESIPTHDIEIDLEKLKLNKYTYFAYITCNTEFQAITVSENIPLIKINPILYVMHVLDQYKKGRVDSLKYNNFDYLNFLKEFNQYYYSTWEISYDDFEHVFYPDYSYLKYLDEKFTSNHFRYFPENIKIIINSVDYTHLNIENKIELINQINAQENITVLDSSGFDSTLSHSLQLSKEYKKSNVYLCTKDEEVYLDEPKPSNLMFTNFVSRNSTLNYRSSVNRIDSDVMGQCLDEIVNKLGFNSTLIYEHTYKNYKEKFFIEQKAVKQDAEDNFFQMDFVSYYFEALLEPLQKNTIQYLTPTSLKYDVNLNSTRYKITDLQYFKNVSARWPQSYALYYAQQNAVNLYMDNNTKVFSVNGPPGTGKTTLLKDIVANVITNRTRWLINNQFKLFDDSNELSSKLCEQYEIIVTSNNNTAVENISMDLPKVDEIDLDYINIKKKQFLLSEVYDAFYGFESWSFISARLGSKKNVNDFVTRLKRAREKFDKLDFSHINIHARLNELSNKFTSIESRLRELESLFELVLMDEDIFLGDVSKHELILSESMNELAKKKKEVSDKESNIFESEDKIKTFNTVIGTKEIMVSDLNLKISSFGILKRFFKRKVYKELLHDKEEIEDDIKKANKQLNEEKSYKLYLEKEVENLNAQLNSISDNVSFNKRHLTKSKESLKKYHDAIRNKYYNVNDEAFFSQKEEKIQVSRLFNHKEYLQKKADLFKVSMLINELIYLKHFKKLYYEMEYFTNNYSSLAMNEEQIKRLRKSFSTLCFVFPVVSTTLASSYNLLKHQKTIGHILCDESGQATPQSFIGCLNRSKKALVVGDPLQVEPVFTVPSILVTIFAKLYDMGEQFNPLFTSVQTLADNTNMYGTYYKLDGKDKWVGMPLVVHSRCQEPMFSISNEISYNNKMVYATGNTKIEEVNTLPESCWYHVKTSNFNGNGSKEEMDFARKIFAENKDVFNLLKDENKPPLFIISPFKDIYKLSNENTDKSDLIGTVHKFQGKEHEVVVFILGGSTNGAKAWASSKSNILNVAVTRAKCRLYIIGDYDKWSKLSYFDTAAKKLPVKY